MRWGRTLLAAGSLASVTLGVVVLVSWPLSYFRGQLLARNIVRGTAMDGSEDEWFIRSNFGVILAAHNRKQWPYVQEPNPLGVTGWFGILHTPSRDFSRPGVGRHVGPFGVGRHRSNWSAGGEASARLHEVVRVPHWFAAGALLAPLIYLRRRWRAWRRVRAGLCAACGYDLRESSERCPECGLAVSNRAATSR